MKLKERREYQVKSDSCYSKNMKCFTPFSGNGRKICRLFELGMCPGSIRKIGTKGKNEQKN